MNAERHARLAGALREQSGGRAREASGWFVPGRIEVLGKHTDYAGGRSLICAAERGFTILAAPRPDRLIHLTDVARGSSVTVSLDSGAPLPAEPRWATYGYTAVRRLARNFPGASVGMDAVFESDLPSASGLSSSSALMIAIALSIVDLNGLARDSRWISVMGTDEDLAAYLATVENGQSFGPFQGDAGVGTAGGSEDHTAILCSSANELRQFGYRPTTLERTVSVPGDLVFAVGVSGVAARKTGEARGQYNRASALAGRLLERWTRATGRADATLAAALRSSPEALDELRAIVASDPDPEFGAGALLDRLNHFVEESEVLVPTAAEALASGHVSAFGDAAARSQAIAEDLLGNQVPQTSALARLAREHGAAAASAFGAGFGGSVWALVKAAEGDRFLAAWTDAYRRAWPDAAPRSAFFLTRPGPAASRLGFDAGAPAF